MGKGRATPMIQEESGRRSGLKEILSKRGRLTQENIHFVSGMGLLATRREGNVERLV